MGYNFGYNFGYNAGYNKLAHRPFPGHFLPFRALTVSDTPVFRGGFRGSSALRQAPGNDGQRTIEASSLGTAKTHLNQVAKSFGERFRVQKLALSNLQEHVERRRKKGISSVTLKKEIATLRACWNWAVHGGDLKGSFPNRGLRFPKEEEKEPFRIFDEIEAIIAAQDPDEARQEELWEALYLTRPELEEFLAYVQQHGTQPWLFPMAALAAYTGARRSEFLRALTTDVSLDGAAVTIHEKKRVRGKRSTRTALITPKLDQVLRDWLAIRP